MAISSIVNSLNSKMRMSGMVSGLDTDTMVKQMMAAETAKVDKLTQKRELAIWRTDAYRDVTSTLQGFYNEYFDVLSTKKINSENSFTGFSASYAVGTSTDYISVTPNADAKVGTYSITEIKAATAAIVSGGSATKAVEGSVVTDAGVAAINSANSNNTFVFTLNNKKVQFTLNASLTLDTVEEFQTELQNKLNDAFGTGRVIVGATGGKFSFTANSTDVFSIGSEGLANAALGLGASNLSNKVNLSAKIYDIKNLLSNTLTVAGTAGDIAFTINGKDFAFNSKEVSLNDIMNRVNADTSINASMKYDITTNSFKIESKSTGVAEKLVVADKTAENLLQALGINTVTQPGTDASVKIEGMDSIVRSTNVFTYNGLTFDIKKDSVPDAVPVKVTVARDTTKTYEFIKGFVDKYNEVIDKLNTKISEKRYSDYTPLTDEQESGMTKEQIEKWETKAKSGLLKGDSIISGVLNKMRSALYDSVDGVGISLSSIGIATSNDYSKKGKLIIDETKLKEALASKPEEVSQLFTNSSDISYYDAINDSSARAQRYSEAGMADRFSDIIQDAIRTSTDNKDKKGALLEKAGIVGDRSEYKNILYKEIIAFDNAVSDLNAKLADRETALYAKFTAMETALSRMNSQSSWLAQQFGSSSGS